MFAAVWAVVAPLIAPLALAILKAILDKNAVDLEMRRLFLRFIEGLEERNLASAKTLDRYQRQLERHEAEAKKPKP